VCPLLQAQSFRTDSKRFILGQMPRSGQAAPDLRALMRHRQQRPALASVAAPPKAAPCEFDTFLLDETRLAASAARFLSGETADIIEIKGQTNTGDFRLFWPLHDSDYGEHRKPSLQAAILKATALLRVSLFGGSLRYVDHTGSEQTTAVKGRVAQTDRLAVSYETDGNGITDIYAKGRRRLGSIHGDAGAEIAKADADGFRYQAHLKANDNQLLLTFTPLV
jgi:hypothetical protein